MAASFNESQKIDYLWKKVGYGVTKTAEPASKEAFNESIPSPLLYRGDLIWTQSGDIPATPPANTTSIVQVYKDGGGAGYSPTVQCTEDLTAPDNQTWKTNSTNWIPTQFGDNYLVQVYAGAANISNPQTAGTKLFGAGSGSDDTWFFDYQSGVLNFNGATIPTAIGTGTANVIYVVGYRYVGEFGVDTTFISNGTSNVNIGSANANVTISVNGTGNVAVFSNTGAYVSGAVSASGNITGGNILSNNYYYANGTPVPPGIIYTANTAPPVSPAPKVTDQWYDTANDVLYEYLYDGTSNYWIDTTSPAFAGGVVANVAISGTLLPIANVSYDVGNSTAYFRNTYTQNLYTNNRLPAYNMPLGAVVQTVMSSSLGGSITNSTSYADVTYANVTITPSSATSKILIIATGTSEFSAVSGFGVTSFTQLVRGASTSLQVQSTGTSGAGGTDAGATGAISYSYMDAPATTGAVTYKLQQKVSTASSTLTSTNIWLIAQEIAAS
tara:strand:+ start:505 stop:1998 length:1494 start_codon:yes stop_codon:yes gene_type:complete